MSISSRFIGLVEWSAVLIIYERKNLPFRLIHQGFPPLVGCFWRLLFCGTAGL